MTVIEMINDKTTEYVYSYKTNGNILSITLSRGDKESKKMIVNLSKSTVSVTNIQENSHVIHSSTQTLSNYIIKVSDKSNMVFQVNTNDLLIYDNNIVINFDIIIDDNIVNKSVKYIFDLEIFSSQVV